MKHVQILVSDEDLPQVMMRVAPYTKSVFVETTDQAGFSLASSPAPPASLVTEPEGASSTGEEPLTRSAIRRAKPTVKKINRSKWTGDGPARSAKAVVLDILGSGKPVHLTDLRQKLLDLGFQKNTASATVTYLLADKRAKRVEPGVYQLTSQAAG